MLPPGEHLPGLEGGSGFALQPALWPPPLESRTVDGIIGFLPATVPATNQTDPLAFIPCLLL